MWSMVDVRLVEVVHYRYSLSYWTQKIKLKSSIKFAYHENREFVWSAYNGAMKHMALYPHKKHVQTAGGTKNVGTSRNIDIRFRI